MCALEENSGLVQLQCGAAARSRGSRYVRRLPFQLLYRTVQSRTTAAGGYALVTVSLVANTLHPGIFANNVF